MRISTFLHSFDLHTITCRHSSIPVKTQLRQCNPNAVLNQKIFLVLAKCYKHALKYVRGYSGAKLDWRKDTCWPRSANSALGSSTFVLSWLDAVDAEGGRGYLEGGESAEWSREGVYQAQNGVGTGGGVGTSCSNTGWIITPILGLSSVTWGALIWAHDFVSTDSINHRGWAHTWHEVREHIFPYSELCPSPVQSYLALDTAQSNQFPCSSS